MRGARLADGFMLACGHWGGSGRSRGCGLGRLLVGVWRSGLRGRRGLVGSAGGFGWPLGNAAVIDGKESFCGVEVVIT